MLVALFAIVACSAEIPETGSSGRTVVDKEPQEIVINVNNINQNYLLTDANSVPRDNITIGDNITISIVNSPTNNNTACNIVDNSSDNSSDNGSCVAFGLRVLQG